MNSRERERLAFLGREPDANEESDYTPDEEAYWAREGERAAKWDRVMAKLAKRRDRMAQGGVRMT